MGCINHKNFHVAMPSGKRTPVVARSSEEKPVAVVRQTPPAPVVSAGTKLVFTRTRKLNLTN